MKQKLGLLLLICITLTSFYSQSFEDKKYWHIEFDLSETEILPVTAYLSYTTQLELVIINAEERIPLTNIETKEDSIFIKIDLFNSELKCKVIAEDRIVGAWYNYNKGKDYAIPFRAVNSYLPRFKSSPSSIDVSGKWEVMFDYDTDTPEKSIGLFNEMNAPCTDCKKNYTNHIKGTFLTETGDYRFLAGNLSKDSLYLSTFDGTHAFLFKAQLRNDTLWGEFYSGTHYKSKWYAIKNESVKLSDPYHLTYRVSDLPLTFSLPDLKNQVYTYPNKQIENKVTLIQLMGSWCPNCLDESYYLKEIKTKYADEIEIISIGFEACKSLQENLIQLQKYRDKLGLNFTYLLGGKASKSVASDLFPMLNEISSFPTLIFVDKSGKIRKIHTGFSGPSTGVYYEHFKTESNLFISHLIAENIK
jgi:thiol-disulfide isomerase/thioredoxin